MLSYLHDLYFLATVAGIDGHFLVAKDAAEKLADRVAPHVAEDARTAGVPYGATDGAGTVSSLG